MAKFQSVDELVEATRPVNPVYCIREDSIETSAAWFKNNFPGNILYAVKANPNEKVLKTLLKNNIIYRYLTGPATVHLINTSLYIYKTLGITYPLKPLNKNLIFYFFKSSGKTIQFK